MNIVIIFIIVAVIAFITFFVFSYMEQLFLGMISAVIMFSWPTLYWLVTKVSENYGSGMKKDARGMLKQDIIEQKAGDTETTGESKPEEEFVIPPKKDEIIKNKKDELEKLKKASEFLDEEKKEGVLSEDAYNELKKQNKESIEKLEQEIAKASGEITEKMIYCQKGKHYISERDCIPSKIDGYVICQEHNEEIRVE